mmetsp:Transcript_17957/g.35822  ORF Transcript_17957/g.35822 Transcript_17957/m.35822 type:complete len:252 (+) Transcript_17957:1191-1946(+)
MGGEALDERHHAAHGEGRRSRDLVEQQPGVRGRQAEEINKRGAPAAHGHEGADAVGVVVEGPLERPVGHVEVRADVGERVPAEGTRVARRSDAVGGLLEAPQKRGGRNLVPRGVGHHVDVLVAVRTGPRGGGHQLVVEARPLREILDDVPPEPRAVAPGRDPHGTRVAREAGRRLAHQIGGRLLGLLGVRVPLGSERGGEGGFSGSRPNGGGTELEAEVGGGHRFDDGVKFIAGQGVRPANSYRGYRYGRD